MDSLSYMSISSHCRESGKVSLVRALDRETLSRVQVVVTVQDDVPANIVALSRTIRGEYQTFIGCYN